MELVITPRTISSDNPSSVPVVFLTWLVVSYTFACANRDSVEKTWGRFLNEAYLRCTYLQGRMHVLAGTVARTCKDGCKYVRGRMQVRARRDASTCEEGCSALQGGMQCTAGAVAVHCRDGCSALRLRWVKLALKSSSPILDRRKGRKDSPHMGHCSPQAISAEPLKALYKMRHFL